MNTGIKGNSTSEKGVALVIALFAILLISALGMGLVLSSGTETNITANYKIYTQSFYSALAGTEEGRVRMIPAAADFCCGNPPIAPYNVMVSATGIAPPPFTVITPPVPIVYILNPTGSEAVNPDPASTNTNKYKDPEVTSEFPSVTVNTLNSEQFGTATASALAYKWVRITPKTEFAVNMDLNGDGIIDSTNAAFLDGSVRQRLYSATDPIFTSSSPIVPSPVWLITSLAVMPDGTQRLLQVEAAQPPFVQSDGALDSKASINIQGTFNALGTYCDARDPAYSVTGPCSGATYNLCQNGVCLDQLDNRGTCRATIPCPKKATQSYCNTTSSAGGVKTSGTLSPTPPSPTGGGNYLVQGNAACAPGDPTCTNNYTTQSTFPFDLNAIVSAYAPIATPVTSFPCCTTCTTGTSCAVTSSFGTLPNYPTCPGGGANPSPPFPCFGQAPPYNNTPTITYANMGAGNQLKLKAGSSGSGILIVDGDLTLEGGFQWFGQIVVTGKLTFLGGGATGTNIFGSVVAGQDVQGDNTTSGGSVRLVYDPCAFMPNMGANPLKLVAFREK